MGCIGGSLDPALVSPLYLFRSVLDTCLLSMIPYVSIRIKKTICVKSTALWFGNSTKDWVGGFGTACIGSLALGGFNAKMVICFSTGNLVYLNSNLCLLFVILYGAGWPYFIFLTAASGQLAW